MGISGLQVVTASGYFVGSAAEYYTHLDSSSLVVVGWSMGMGKL
jgi:hypothetical protein